MKPDLRQLRAFVAVADAGQFTLAAARLGVAQPSVSRTIAQLERRVGARLFDRDVVPVELTAAGRSLLVHARVLLAAEERLEAAMRAHRAPVARTFVVGLHDEGLGALTEPVLEAFAARYPDVRVRVDALAFHEVPGALTDGRVDAVLRTSMGADETDAFTRVYDDPLVLQVSRRSPLADADRLTVADVLSGDPPFVATGDLPVAWVGPFVLAAHRAGEPPPSTGLPVPTGMAEVNHQIVFDGVVGVGNHGVQPFFGDARCAYVPLDDAEPLVVGVAIPDRGADELHRALVALAVQHAEQG